MLSSINESFKAGIDKLKGRSEEDKGDLVQTIIIIAGFAVAAIVIIGGITSTLMNKGEAVAGCISGSNSFTAGSEARDNCEAKDDEAQTESGKDITDNFGNSGIGAATSATSDDTSDDE